VLAAPQQFLCCEVAPDEGKRGLQAVHVADPLGAIEFLHVVVRQPCGADFSFLLQIQERLPVALQ
jgi:hypothetical protein